MKKEKENGGRDSQMEKGERKEGDRRGEKEGIEEEKGERWRGEKRGRREQEREEDMVEGEMKAGMEVGGEEGGARRREGGRVKKLEEEEEINDGRRGNK